MGTDAPFAADQDVLVDANIFYAIGHPSNPQYQRFRSAVQNAGVVCKLPRRVIGELGGSETDRVRTALDEGWVKIIAGDHRCDRILTNKGEISRSPLVEHNSPTGKPFSMSVHSGDQLRKAGF